MGFARDWSWSQFDDKAKENGCMFSVTSQLNWLHKVLSFICQCSKPELSVAFRSGTLYYNGLLSFHLPFLIFLLWLYGRVGVVNIKHLAFVFF